MADLGARSQVTTTVGASQVRVAWAAPPAGAAVDHYLVTLAPGGQTCTTTTLSCLFGAQPDTRYTATVAAVGANGEVGPAVEASSSVVSAPPVSPAPPQTSLTLTTDKGLISRVDPSERLVVVGTGFLPQSTATIVIYSTPVVLGTVITDAQGDFSKPITVPATLPSGLHHLVAVGVAPDGTSRSLRMDVTYVARAGAGGGLAYTGVAVVLPATLGGGGVLLGGLLVVSARRRRMS